MAQRFFWFANPVEVTLTVTNTYVQYDLSVLIPNLPVDFAGVVIRRSIGADSYTTFRSYGTTTNGYFLDYNTILVNISSSRILEAIRTTNNAGKNYIDGYYTTGFGYIVYGSEIEVSPGTRNQWVTLPSLPSGAVAGLYRIGINKTKSSYDYLGIRSLGSTDGELYLNGSFGFSVIIGGQAQVRLPDNSQDWDEEEGWYWSSYAYCMEVGYITGDGITFYTNPISIGGVSAANTWITLTALPALPGGTNGAFLEGRRGSAQSWGSYVRKLGDLRTFGSIPYQGMRGKGISPCDDNRRLQAISSVTGIGYYVRGAIEGSVPSLSTNYTRTTDLAMGLALTSTRTVGYTRASSMALGIKLLATRAVGYKRTSPIPTGIMTAATRAIGFIRETSASIAMAVTTSRAVGYVRQAVIAMGAAISSNRLVQALRDAVAAIGITISTDATIGRNYIFETLLAIDAAVTNNRQWLGDRAADIGMAQELMAFRQGNFPRSADIQAGVAVTSSRIRGVVRSATVAIGHAVASSHLIALVRNAAVACGLWVMGTTGNNRVYHFIADLITNINATATRKVAAQRSTTTATDIASNATRTTEVTRSTHISQVPSVTASRVWRVVRGAALACGLLITTSVGRNRRRKMITGTSASPNLSGQSRALNLTGTSSAIVRESA